MDQPHLVWVRLLSQLERMLQDSATPQVGRRFRSFGPHRLAAAQRQLLREQQRLLAEAARLNVPIDAEAVTHAAHELPAHADLALQYLAAAGGYRLAAELAHLKGEMRLTRWMTERSRLHEQHSRFLRSG